MREAAELETGPKGMILDVGCGGGLFLEMLPSAARARATAAWRVWIFRWTPPTWRGGAPEFQQCARRFPARPSLREVVLVVTMFHVLEHLYDPGSYLAGAHELLAPEGRLIVQVPNAACWQFLLLGERWSGIDVPRHLIDFRPEGSGFAARNLRV